ncbi:MAG: hypothetical protein C0401_07480 [Anaerolinea sp.]|nr:hypothetical protein [Anaerolinea sp.]
MMVKNNRFQNVLSHGNYLSHFRFFSFGNRYQRKKVLLENFYSEGLSCLDDLWCKHKEKSS